jgi:predicted dienelactone hydrolase
MLAALRRVAAPIAFGYLCLVGGCYTAGASMPADPAAAGPLAVATHDAQWTDSSRQRVLPVRIREPKGGGDSLPVILFSHGLGGSREGGSLWGEHWASHGFLVIHLQHPGSDEALWKPIAGDPSAAMKSLRAGATPVQLAARHQDVKFVLDELARRQASGDTMLRRADLMRVGMSGHSFGAQTTLALAGQQFARASPATSPFAETRIRAAIAFSPASRKRAGDLDKQFGAIRIPMLLITGTRDGDVIGDGTTPESRAQPFAHMPGPGKYLAVFEGGDHRVFGGHILRRVSTDRDDAIRSGTKALTLAFWQAHLRGDAEAKAWLEDGGARAFLSKGDRYETRH